MNSHLRKATERNYNGTSSMKTTNIHFNLALSLVEALKQFNNTQQRQRHKNHPQGESSAGLEIILPFSPLMEAFPYI